VVTKLAHRVLCSDNTATKVINGVLCINKPGEMCRLVTPGWWTDEGCFDDDDAKWHAMMAKLKADEEIL